MPNNFTTTKVIPTQIICDQIINAFEGGISYWCSGAARISSKIESKKKPWYSDVDVYTEDFQIDVYADGKTYKLTPAEITRGLDVMGRFYPKHMADMITEEGDATTADVFMQCCLFGELIYG